MVVQTERTGLDKSYGCQHSVKRLLLILPTVTINRHGGVRQQTGSALQRLHHKNSHVASISEALGKTFKYTDAL